MLIYSDIYYVIEKFSVNQNTERSEWNMERYEKFCWHNTTILPAGVIVRKTIVKQYW